MGKLSGKIALITDGNSGIGLESARVFIEEGARVFLTERNRETLDAGARSVGSQAITIRRTQKTSREIDKLFAAIAGQVDGLDILFGNAGVGRATPAGPGARSGLRRTLRRQREGRVLHRPGGAAATQARKHNHPQCFRWCLQWLAGYAASKAAVRSLARGFSADLVKRGIRVNVLSPGPTATPVWERTGVPVDIVEPTQRRLQRSIPAGRLGTPQGNGKCGSLTRIRRFQLHAGRGDHRPWRRDSTAERPPIASANQKGTIAMSYPSIAAVVGRALLALLFLLAGTAKLLGPAPYLAHMAEFHVPGYLLWAVIALEIGAGAALLLGCRLVWSAGALTVFCVLTASIFHFDSPVPAERTRILKNLANPD